MGQAGGEGSDVSSMTVHRVASSIVSLFPSSRAALIIARCHASSSGLPRMIW